MIVFDFISYPSIYCPILTLRYYTPNDSKHPQNPSMNPFLIDFLRELEIMGRAKTFKDDHEVRRKAVCKSLYLNRETY